MFMKKTLATIFIASVLMVSMGGIVSADHSVPHTTAEANLAQAIADGESAAAIAALQGIVDATAGGVEGLPDDFSPLPTIATTGGEAVEAITAITNWLFVILSVIAVIFIVLAGLQFITGGGNPEAVGEARMKLMYAAVGIAVALLARAVPFVISSILGA